MFENLLLYLRAISSAMKKKKTKKKPGHRMSERERALWDNACQKAKEQVALHHNFHEPPEKTSAQIKADEYAKKHSQPRKPKVASASRRPFARIIYTPMGGQSRY